MTGRSVASRAAGIDAGRRVSTVAMLATKGASYLVLGVAAVSMLLPLLWMASTSLKEPGNIFLLPPQLIPRPIRWLNYADLFTSLPFSLFIWNSLKIASINVIGRGLSCSLAGFAFARMRFPGSRVLFLVFLSTMMIPEHVTMIPAFYIVRTLGWIDSHLSLTVPSFLGGAFGIFLLRQFFLSIPQELVDAARIDGCSFFGIYSRIFMPLAKPALSTLTVIAFMSSWNSLLGPLIYLNSLRKMTIPLGLALLAGGYQSPGKYAVVMAGAMIAIVPMLAIFVSAQKYFVEGIARAGLKG